MTTDSPPKKEKKEVLFHGIPASPGIAIGEILIAGNQTLELAVNSTKTIDPSQADKETELFHKALDVTREEIKTMQNRMMDTMQKRSAGIFDAHLLIVSDRMLNGEVVSLIKNKFLPADVAFSRIIQKYIAAIQSMNSQYFRERADDIKDVAVRIMNNLNGLGHPALGCLPAPVIIISRDLTPSDTALLDRRNVLGFAIETGSRTSHTAILARSLQLPAVVGMQHFVERLENGDRIIIDGFLGMVIAHPKPETEALYRLKLKQKEKLYAELLQESRMRAETLDGFCIELFANVEGVGGIASVQQNGAEGIGLFRTEYLFMNEKKLPAEEKQFLVYKELAEKMQGQPVVIRTLDLGGDKLDPALTGTDREPNPFLGLRAIRLCQAKPEILETQLRAILRAGAYGNIRIMFPMVSSMEELEYLLETVKTVKKALSAEGIAYSETMPVGMMVEIPSAAVSAERFAGKVDFFSIGSNDLVQYSLAVDRGNEKVAYLYRPTHPAILSLIRNTALAGRKNGIFTAVCGEIAGDPLFTPLLIGLGVRELSMTPVSLSIVRRMVRRIKMHDAEVLAEKALRCNTASEVHALASEFLNEAAPDLSNL